jgi:hypothetical protein
MATASLSLPQAREQLDQIASNLAALEVGGATSHVTSRETEDISRLTDLIRACDDVLFGVQPDATADPLEGRRVINVTRGLRRALYLLLTERVPDEAWYWTPEWQAREREADTAYAEGRTTMRESGAALLAALKARR